MDSFTVGAVSGMTAGGALIGWSIWNRPWYGLFSGMIYSTIAIGIEKLFGRKVSALYVASIVIYTVGNIARKAQNSASLEKIKDIFKSKKTYSELNVDCVEIERPEEIRCDIAWQTYKAVKQGFYIDHSRVKHFLSSGEELLAQSHFFPNTTTVIASKRFESTYITVVEQDCLEAAQDAIQEESEQKFAVVMFASPLEAGGGMSDGNKGQEEDLCRRSDIFGLMWDQAHFNADPILYPLVGLERANQKDPVYSEIERNGMIHTPHVTVFRASQAQSYEFLNQPFEVGMLVSPAPSKPRLAEGDYAREEDKEQMKKVITTQLSIAYEQGYEIIILGAFGCGAFQNPPQAVAQLYREIIYQDFKGAFKKIVFAILEDSNRGHHNRTGNLRPFQEIFGKDPFLLCSEP